MGDASIRCFIFYLVGGCMRVKAMPDPSSRCPVLKMFVLFNHAAPWKQWKIKHRVCSLPSRNR